MDEQKVLAKARAYRLAYKEWGDSITDGNNTEKSAKLTAKLMLTQHELLETATEEAMGEPPMEYPKYEEDEPIIYVNGTKAELGIVKKVCGDDEYFINYHTGDTAARTHARNLVKISNRYAFHIYRLDPDDNERKKIVGTTTVDKSFEKLLLDNCPEVKKKLEAFEIIKREPMVLSVVQGYETYDDFQDDEEPWLDYDCVSRDDFDLLKEELK